MTDPKEGDMEPRSEAGRRLVSEPEWSDKQHRRLAAIAIETEAHNLALDAVAEAVDRLDREHAAADDVDPDYYGALNAVLRIIEEARRG